MPERSLRKEDGAPSASPWTEGERRAAHRMKLQWPVAVRAKTPPQLRPAGHSAAAEAMVQPIIFLGSTILAVVACYVLAQPQIGAVAAGNPTAIDVLLIMLVAGLGVMVDTAMVLSASRFRMHLARGKRDWPWAIITGLMLLLCLSVESMTLVYFGYLVSPSSVPTQVASIVVSIHDVLFFIRNLMPPLVIAFFTTCLLPLTIEPADRDRATKATTSVTIAALQEDLVKVGPLASRNAKIQALADQIALNEHASHATADEKSRNAALIAQLRSQGTLAAEDVERDAPDNVATPLSLQAHLEAVEERIGNHLRTWGSAFRTDLLRSLEALVAPQMDGLVGIEDEAAPMALDLLGAPGERGQMWFGERTGDALGDHEAQRDGAPGQVAVRHAVLAAPVHVTVHADAPGDAAEVASEAGRHGHGPRAVEGKAKPLPGTREYPPYLDTLYRTVVTDPQRGADPMTLEELVQLTGDSSAEVIAGIRSLRETQLASTQAGKRPRRKPASGLLDLLQ